MTRYRSGFIRKYARAFLLWCFDGLALLVPRRRAGSKQRVLIVKLDGIGDFILWLDAAKELKALYPPAAFEITLAANALLKSFAEQVPYFDAVRFIDLQAFLNDVPYRLRSLAGLRRAGFDLVVQPTYSRRFLHGDSVVRTCGAKAIGFRGDPWVTSRWLKLLSDRWYSRLLPASEGSLHELDRNAEFLHEWGVKDFRAGLPRIPISCDPPPGFGHRQYYILFPGAGLSIKRWPLQNFSRIAEHVYSKTGLTGIICGGPADRKIGDRLVSMSGAPLENWSGNASLTGSIAMISRASILIGNDTSAIHIAAAAHVPSVCIVGGWHDSRFVPYPDRLGSHALPVVVRKDIPCAGCNAKCIHEPGEVLPCIGLIPVDDVWNATRAVLEKIGLTPDQKQKN